MSKLIFEPDYTPVEMFSMGIMGGNYFKKEVKENWTDYVPNEFVIELSKLDDRLYLNPVYDRKINKFGVKCGLEYKEWLENGWIHEQDPFGWINWYINFFYGRDSEDDVRQIKRWQSFKRRHTLTLKRTGDVLDLSHGHKTRQNLLHWAIDSTKLI